MKKLVLLLCLFATPVWAVDPPIQQVVFLPAAPQPLPPPPPPPATLAMDAMFAFDADVECVVLASPVTVASVVSEAGPIRVRGKFSDGTGAVECRTFKRKYVYIVEPQAAGAVEVLVIFTPPMQSTQVVRRQLIVGTPVPPTPPTPPPQPPTPSDPFSAALTAAYASEPSPTKAVQVKQLASIYRMAATPAVLGSVATTQELFDRMHAAAETLVGSGSLPAVRAAIAKELTSLFPTAATTPIAQTSALCVTQFTRIAALLEAIK